MLEATTLEPVEEQHSKLGVGRISRDWSPERRDCMTLKGGVLSNDQRLPVIKEATQGRAYLWHFGNLDIKRVMLDQANVLALWLVTGIVRSGLPKRPVQADWMEWKDALGSDTQLFDEVSAKTTQADAQIETQRIKLRKTTVNSVLNEWTKHVQTINIVGKKLAKEDSEFRAALRSASIADPKVDDAAQLVEEQIVQLLDTVAIDRYEADLVGYYPITFKRTFIPEFRRALVNLVPIPKEEQTEFLQGIYNDLVRTVRRKAIKRVWGALIEDAGELVLNIAKRSSKGVKLPSRFTIGWRPVER